LWSQAISAIMRGLVFHRRISLEDDSQELQHSWLLLAS